MKRWTTLLLAGLASAWLAAPAMADDKAHFVLVPGAWHVGAAWQPVMDRLDAQGYTAQALTLPGHGEDVDRAGVTFADAEAALIEAVRSHDGNVILVGHSAAGVLLQQAAGKVAGQLDAVVFHNAFLIEDGTSLEQNLPPDIAATFRQIAEASGDNSIGVGEDFWRNVLLAGVEEERATEIIDMMVPQPFGFYTHEIDTSSFADVTASKFVLLATDDASLPPGAWAGMAMWLGDATTVEIPGGHEVLLTDPDAVAQGLVTIAESL
ncbi:MAG: alpha/beta hydrolase [Phyllobacteriaceae bacterium]|jgi:pimeloyl-ACP methyl ester carboxylesterase|nr:alpha/beta hydrolase [Phyllobacteriaceae bacterium]